ncbi:DMT family transporter [Oceaniglobus roseus]|uniref:DMT family transporter n=1 Tax=Oceaniglobus roseus TaxID=1737570 RepID=UPI000C7E9EC6|nr:DMT family transporter [Kandeliimicrobium roseum]
MSDEATPAAAGQGRPLWLAAAPVVFLLLWSGGYAVAKIGLEHAAPLTILCLRYALVVGIMGAAFVVLRPPLPKRAADWGHLALVGVLIQTVYFGMTYMALLNGLSAGLAAIILSFQPILVALIAPRWSGEPIRIATWIGLVLALAGAVTVIVARLDISPPPPLVFLLALLGLAGITGATLWEKRFGLSHHPVTANLIGYGAGLICLLPFWAVQDAAPVRWNWEFVWVMVYLVLGNSVIAVGLLLAMIRAGEVARVSALMFLVPPLAGLIAWATLGEVMPPLAWVGFALAGGGVYLATRRARG